MSFDIMLEVSVHDDVNTVVMEAMKRILPKKLKEKITLTSVRKEMLEKCGRKAFLLPDELKFPIYNPDTCKPDCRLIYAAYVRANQWKHKRPEYAKLAEKAKKLYERNKCPVKIGITIRETGEIIELSNYVKIVDGILLSE